MGCNYCFQVQSQLVFWQPVKSIGGVHLDDVMSTMSTMSNAILSGLLHFLSAIQGLKCC